ncbi:MAG: hypothetical protein M1826_006582 [Phylliscum demangeonii]|nr:MAG: hypothetical protein M1826_006582 [Phylliscum demangeonii]
MKRGLSDNQFLQALDQVQPRCIKVVTRRWNSLSAIRNPPNPLGHPHRRALDFQDIKYISPELVDKPLEQVTYEMGVVTGICGCQGRDYMKAPAKYVVFSQWERNNKRKLTNREWGKNSARFFDICRETMAADWVEAATKGTALPHGLPAPTRVIQPKPDFNPDLNWIPHPHGLGRLNVKGLAAAASKVRQEVWDLGEKEERLMLRGLER